MEKNTKWDFKFSVIIPVYNMEKYLDETIESVIKQDIGFKQNIQLILVNGGSTDNSEEIVLKYKEKYPDNIIYLKQENFGVSATRNKGIEHIKGKYVNFLNADDKWNLDAFSKAWDFFEKNYNEIDVVGARIKYCEKNEESHFLDYKFTSDTIVDINENYDYIQVDVNSAFIKAEELKQYGFDSNLKYAEDALLIGKIILKKCKYGIMKSAIYNYRIKDNNSTALNNYKADIEWYTGSIQYYTELIEESMNRYGRVLPYIQYQIAYDLQWKFNIDISKTQIPKSLTGETKRKYEDDVKKFLQYIEDYIIIKQKNIFVDHKILMLNVKYGKHIEDELTLNGSHIYYNDQHLTNLKNKSVFKIIIMDIEKDELVLEGQVQCILNKNDYIVYAEKTNKGKKEKQMIELNSFNLGSPKNLFGQLADVQNFKIRIPIEKGMKIKFILKYKEENGVILNCKFGKFAKLNTLEESYYKKGKYIIAQEENKFRIKGKNRKNIIDAEKAYLKSLYNLKEHKIIRYRILYHILSKIMKKPIWLISDRTHRANDNGMHLFKYMAKREKQAKIYFVLDKKSADFGEMKKYGKVLKYNTFKYRLFFLLSSKIISSQADEWVINAFEDKKEYVKDLYNFDYIFLQHGITQNNIAKWLNKYNKNIRLFVTCAVDEYNSIINNEDYLYSEKEVKLVGFPRYDNLKNEANKSIVFMPTWRKQIADKLSPRENSSTRKYSPFFKNTDYFKFYDNLINDPRILEIMKKYGYKGKFCIHPSFEAQYIDFRKNPYIEISPKIADYQKEFSENSLLITDFSSVAFDFAYLRKPVIYTQFDIDSFYEGNLYDKGYFDYEEDGFGPVIYSYEDSVEEIVKSIENNCKLEDKYLQRINKFYAFNDHDNCKRVYEEILKL